VLLIDNAAVAAVLEVPAVIAVLEQAYRDLAAGDAVCRPRIDVRLPTGHEQQVYQWGSMEGGSVTSGYFAIRMKSDVLVEREYAGTRTQEKHCLRPGTFCGLVFLLSARTGEPLAILNDGIVQHLRVGADAAIGTRYAAREDARVLGLLGSGGMARSHLEALLRVRRLERVQVFSPTREHRERYAAEMRDQHGLEVSPSPSRGRPSAARTSSPRAPTRRPRSCSGSGSSPACTWSALGGGWTRAPSSASTSGCGWAPLQPR
jgi:alanine dehydrogenase